MKRIVLAAILAAGLAGMSVSSAMADKTWNSDPSVYSTSQGDYGQIYCNADGTQCWKAQ